MIKWVFLTAILAISIVLFQVRYKNTDNNSVIQNNNGVINIINNNGSNNNSNIPTPTPEKSNNHKTTDLNLSASSASTVSSSQKKAIGSIDGIYSDEANGTQATIHWKEKTIELLSFNCAFYGSFIEKDNGFDIYKTGADGACRSLHEINDNEIVLRIIPKSGELTNSYLITGFYMGSLKSNVDGFQGEYTFKEMHSDVISEK